MKKQRNRLLCIVSLSLLVVSFCPACCQTEQAETQAATGDIPASLTCQEHGNDDDMSWRVWRRGTTLSGIVRGGLASEGDLLWVSTGHGLIRLDVRTWQCDLFTQAAGRSLARAHPLLPDGEGGLWMGAGESILRFSGERWQVAYEIPEGYPQSITALGLGQTGSLCAQMQGGWRSLTFYRTCLAGNTFPMNATSLIVDDPYATRNCDLWQRVSSRRHNYTTPAGCEQIKQRSEPGHDSPAAASADGSQVWMVRKYPENDLLFHWQGEAFQWDQAPYRDIYALTIDPVHGGVWMASGDGLVHVHPTSGAKSGDSSRDHFTFRPLLLDIGAFPGSVLSIVVDRDGQVWTADHRSVLQYDEANRFWHRTISVSWEIGAIAADPAKGIWVAGREELLHCVGGYCSAWDMPGSHRGMPMALSVDGSGRMWMGTLEDGVWTAISPTQSKELDWRRFATEDGLVDERITALVQGPDGRIYAAHHAGISVFDPTGGIMGGCWITLPGSDIGGDGWANALAIAPSPQLNPERLQEGTDLWAGYHHPAALRRYQYSLWKNYHFEDESPSGSIGALLVSEDGALWIGTDRGLWRRLPGGEGYELRWQKLAPDTLTVRNILALAQDGQGHIWAGGPEGLAVWEGGQ